MTFANNKTPGHSSNCAAMFRAARVTTSRGFSTRRTRRRLLSLHRAVVMSPWIFIVVAVCQAASTAADAVPELCNLIDQPMYCRCDVADPSEDVTDVRCYIGRKLTPDHVVFRAFKRQTGVTALEFTAFGGDYHLDFVPRHALHHTPQIERLKISQAELGDLKHLSFHNLSRLAVLSLDSNEITGLDVEAIAHLPRLKRLELGDNKLRRLRAGSLTDLPSLTHLFLERNQLEVVDDGAFEDLNSVRELDLSDNLIEELSEASFRGLSRVRRLDLFRNRLQRLSSRVFSGMPEVAELDLKYNNISEVDPQAFDGLPQLTVLYLSYNRLRVLPAHMFRGAPNLVSVDLSQNQLLTITWRTVQDLAKIGAQSFDMSLTGNKFSCDCRLAWILHLENATGNAKFRRELRHIKCDFETPSVAASNATSSKVVRLSIKQLGCPEDYERPALGDHQQTTPPSAHHLDHDDNDELIDYDDAGSATEAEHLDKIPLRPHPSRDWSGEDKRSSVRNDAEVILNQRKAVEKDSAASSAGVNSDVAASKGERRAAVSVASVVALTCAVALSCCS